MRVLVTGAAGFIGSRLCDCLVTDGHTVIGIDNESAGAYRPDDRYEQLTRCANEIEASDFTVDTVVHAACVTMPQGARFPWTEADTNVCGTVNILHYAGAVGAKVVHISSCCVYGQQDHFPIHEDAPFAPAWTPYTAGKQAGEAYCHAFSRQYGTRITVLRPSNVYGPHQRPDCHPGVVGQFISASLRGEPLRIHGTGRDIRDFTYVDDVVEAICRAMDVGAPFGPYNVASGNGTSIDRLADMIGGLKIHSPARDIDGISRRVLSVAKIEAELGWKPSVPLAEGLTKTKRWLRESLLARAE